MFLQDLCGDLVAVNDIQYIEDLQAKDDYQITFIRRQLWFFFKESDFFY